MRKPLKGRRVLHGITGSIAAYKAVDIIRRLKEQEAEVVPVMTSASKSFIAPLSIEVASGCKVSTGIFDDPMAHIALAKESDLLLVAPATANSIGKFANGLADDLLSAIFLSFKGKVIIAPAMNWRMYESPAFMRNLDRLKELGVIEVPPTEGPLACGEEGKGRMAEVETIVEAVKSAFAEKDLAGQRIVITAGPTREYLDDVRFISNGSTGKMGFALAAVALRRGAEVALISGPVSLKPPIGARWVGVETSAQMREAVFRELGWATALIMSSAVTDFAPATRHEGKLEKSSVNSIKLKKTPDILSEVGGMKKRPVLIGFAAESGNRLDRAKKKLIDKGADAIVFNDISSPGSGFGTDTNRIVVIKKKGMERHPLLTKEEASNAVLDIILKDGRLKPNP